MKIDVDVDQLRESLLDRAGSAAGVGFPAAMLDVVDIEDESPQELLARAEREGLDLPCLRHRRRYGRRLVAIATPQPYPHP